MRITFKNVHTTNVFNVNNKFKITIIVEFNKTRTYERVF